jgi:hypothetical protein
MLVLWRDDAGQLLLGQIQDALVALGPRGAEVPAVRIVLAAGQVLVATLDRIHELPRHESTARRRGRW